MRKVLFLTAALTTLLLVWSNFAKSEDAPAKAPERTVQLAGVLERPEKGSPRLELRPRSGQVRSFDLHGDALNDIKEGTLIHVRGVVRTKLHAGQPGNFSPIPNQWIIWLDVTELKILEKEEDIYAIAKEPS